MVTNFHIPVVIRIIRLLIRVLPFIFVVCFEVYIYLVTWFVWKFILLIKEW